MVGHVELLGAAAGRPAPLGQLLDGGSVHVEVEPALVSRVHDGDDAIAISGNVGLHRVGPVLHAVLERPDELAERLHLASAREDARQIVVGHRHVVVLIGRYPRDLGEVDRERRVCGERVVEEVQREVARDAAVGEPVSYEAGTRLIACST